MGGLFKTHLPLAYSCLPVFLVAVSFGFGYRSWSYSSPEDLYRYHYGFYSNWSNLFSLRQLMSWAFWLPLHWGSCVNFWICNLQNEIPGNGNEGTSVYHPSDFVFPCCEYCRGGIGPWISLWFWSCNLLGLHWKPYLTCQDCFQIGDVVSLHPHLHLSVSWYLYRWVSSPSSSWVS